MELQAHLLCPDHARKFCYKPSTDLGPCRTSNHINIDTRSIRDWTTSILAGSATVINPPRTPEFEKLLHPRQRSNGSSTASVATPNLNPVVINVGRRRVSSSNHQRDDSYSPRSSYASNERRQSPGLAGTPRTPRNRHRRPNPPPFSSPLVAHESFDIFGGDGMLAFTDWLEREYKVAPTSTEFKETLQTLQSHNIGVDILQNKDAAWIEKRGVKAGTAERISKSYAKWRGKLLLRT
jgi:hypothetical protein